MSAQGYPYRGRLRDGAYTNGLEIAERLAEADPGNAGWQRDLWVSMWRLRRFEGSGITWTDIAAKMEAMQAAGTLLPTDVTFLEQAKREAATQAGQKP